jgi:hypothetical protein
VTVDGVELDKPRIVGGSSAERRMRHTGRLPAAPRQLRRGVAHGKPTARVHHERLGLVDLEVPRREEWYAEMAASRPPPPAVRVRAPDPAGQAEHRERRTSPPGCGAG